MNFSANKEIGSRTDYNKNKKAPVPPTIKNVTSGQQNKVAKTHRNFECFPENNKNNNQKYKKCG